MTLHTVVLRFYDFNQDTDTIQAHLQIIADIGHVWWGWWKKNQEQWQGQALKDLATKCPLVIGLLNRTSKEFYIARCEEVVLGEDGARIPSPDKDFTPAYYQGSSHPAWFKFSSIEKIDEQKFLEDFSEVPQGEPTFYVVEKKRAGLDLVDEKPTTKSPVKTIGDSILHLSDLHFGDDHGYPPKRLEVPVPKHALAEVIGKVIDSMNIAKIGVVVVSGDLLTKGNSDGYNVAHKFLPDLLSALRLNKEHLVIVPGNHDIPISDFQSAAYQYEPEDPYRNFLKAFYGDENVKIERLQRFITPSNWNFNFLSLNSSSIRKKDYMDYGYVGRDKYAPFLSVLDEINNGRNAAQLLKERTLNFVVLHHHILPVQDVDLPEPERPVSIMLDAGQLIANFQNSNIHYVLHGHQHLPFIGVTARVRRKGSSWSSCDSPLTVLGAGSSGASINRLSQKVPYNTLSVYSPRDDGFNVRIEKYNEQSIEPYLELALPF